MGAAKSNAGTQEIADDICSSVMHVDKILLYSTVQSPGISKNSG